MAHDDKYGPQEEHLREESFQEIELADTLGTWREKCNALGLEVDSLDHAVKQWVTESLSAIDFSNYNGRVHRFMENGTSATADPETGEKANIGLSTRNKLAWIDNDRRVVCCGLNEYNVFGGHHDWVWRSYMHLPDTDEVPAKVWVGYYHMTVLTESGKLYFSGYNHGNMFSCASPEGHTYALGMLTRGMLLNGGPEKVWKKIAFAESHYPATIAALTENGELYLAGENQFGQLGNGTQTDTYNNTSDNRMLNSTPVLTGVKDVVIHGQWNGTSHTSTVVVLMENGQVRACGYGSHGQIGRGHTNSSTLNLNRVKLVDGDTNLGQGDPVVQVVAGGYDDLTCFYAITTSGKLYGWGRNDNRNFGLSSTGTSNLLYATRIDVGTAFDSDVKRVFRGHNQNMYEPTYVQTVNNDWYACGSNNEKMITVTSGNSTNFWWRPLDDSLFTNPDYDVHTMYYGVGTSQQTHFVVATNNEDPNNPLEELWVTGSHSSLATGVGPINSTNTPNISYESHYLLGWHKVPFSSAMVEQIEHINSSDYHYDDNSRWTQIVLKDKSVWFAGRDYYTFVAPSYGNHYISTFQRAPNL